MLMIALAVAASAAPSDWSGPPVAIAVARATILSGVRIDADSMFRASDRSGAMPRPREIACPGDTGVACRLITIDMP